MTDRNNRLDWTLLPPAVSSSRSKTCWSSVARQPWPTTWSCHGAFQRWPFHTQPRASSRRSPATNLAAEAFVEDFHGCGEDPVPLSVPATQCT